jgi:hypothetical protein
MAAMSCAANGERTRSASFCASFWASGLLMA